MLALVLSGGGAKGAYEIGVWKALKKLKIKYDIVTGTSVGALNGVLMVQKDLRKALRIWNNIDNNKIVDDDKIFKKNKALVFTHNFITGGGASITPLEHLIDISVNEKNFFKSNIDFGLITYNISKLKPISLTKKDFKPGDVKKYVTASATCFPFFKKKKINNEDYVDGGYYDNLPINLALSMGADEVIAIDLKAIGLKQKVKNKKIKITYITPNNDIGNILAFEKGTSRRNICFGFNDTMKLYNHLDGNKFTFKKNDLNKNYKKYASKYYHLVKTFINNPKELNEIIEKLGFLLSLDESKIYEIRKYNRLLKKQIQNIQDITFKLDFKKIPDYFDKRKRVKMIYKLMQTNIGKVKEYKMFREEIMMAAYLMIIK